MQTFVNRLEHISIKLVPPVITLIMLVFSAVLGHIPGASMIMPMVVVICVYYWCMFYPGALPYSFLFVLGVLQDSLAGSPLGFSSFINVFFAWILINKFRSFSNVSFAIVWFRFAILSCMAVLLQWCMMILYYGRWLPVEFQVLQWVSSCFAYPLLHSMLVHIYRYR